jgi:hypothetical protein
LLEGVHDGWLISGVRALDGGAEFFEVGEGEGGGEGELEGRAGNEMLGCEDEERGAGLLGEVAEAVPRGGGKPAEFLERGELEVENEKREVAVAKEEIGAAEGFLGMVATDPEKAGAGRGAVGGGVEGVAAVDEGERGAINGRRGGLLKNFGEDKGEAGGGTGGGKLGEGAGGEGRKARGGVNRGGGRFVLMRLRESLPQLTAQVLEIQRHLYRDD